MEQLFSYGTLRSKQIQMQIFNKVLTGTADQLLGYKLKSLQIEEEFGMADYVVAVPSEKRFGSYTWRGFQCYGCRFSKS